MIKKLLAAVLAAAITAAMFVIPAAADFSKAKSLESGKKTTVKLVECDDYVDYKIKVAKSGTLSVKLTSYTSNLEIFVAGSDEIPIKNNKISTLAGSCYDEGKAVTNVYKDYYSADLYSGTIQWKVKKGTYYIRLRCTSYGRNTDRKVTFTATYPSSNSKTSSPVLALNVKKGNTIDFDVADTASSIQWSSSKKSVATVDQNGKITAKKKGTAVITAKTGKTSLKIKIVVK